MNKYKCKVKCSLERSGTPPGHAVVCPQCGQTTANLKWPQWPLKVNFVLGNASISFDSNTVVSPLFFPEKIQVSACYRQRSVQLRPAANKTRHVIT